MQLMTYNQHIFDFKNKKVLRDFESAYKNFDDVYPGQFDLSSPKIKLVMNKILEREEHCRVLDIGSGYGPLVNYLNENGVEAEGVEISPSAIKKGKEKYGNDLRISHGDLVKGLDFKDSSFDVIICYGVIQYLLDSIDECLAEMKRLLVKGGCLALSMGFKDTNMFFRDIISNEKQFTELVGRYFSVEDFLVHYHEINIENTKTQDFNIQNQNRDLIVFCNND